MIDTVVGYCGGDQADPSYERIGDHTEAIRVTFNPKLISLDRMYQIFWQEHTPSFFGRQYRSAIFAHSKTQRDVALAVRKSLAGDSPFATAYDSTAIEEAGPFYRAEEYHRKAARLELARRHVRSGLAAHSNPLLTDGTPSRLHADSLHVDSLHADSRVAAERFLEKQRRGSLWSPVI